MKKFSAILLLFLVFGAKAQYLIVGNDSISAQKFITENEYGLKNSGIDKTIKTYVDFKLLQQFSLSKKADTLSYFKARMFGREKQLREESFYPKEILQNLLNDYLSASQIEKKIQVFYIEKDANDKIDYQKIYEEVKSGKMTMENAISMYTKVKPDAFYTKTGVFDVNLDKELQSLSTGNYTKLINNGRTAAFAKLIDKRPSLGYMVFGAISCKNDDNAEKNKKQILDALKSGKTFEEVAKIYGATENEKNNAGTVLGSPILPDAVYNALVNKKEGENSEPVLLGDNWFILHVFSLIPYKNSEKYNKMLTKEMMETQYADLATDHLISGLVKSSSYKEFPDFIKVKKSYQEYLNFKNPKAILYQYGKDVFTYAELKKVLSEQFKNADKLPSSQWSAFLDMKRNNDVFNSYGKEFVNRKDIKEELRKTKEDLLADYLYSQYIDVEILTKKELIKDFYNKNKSKYIWESRAKGRVAILSDENLQKQIKKEIADIKNWEDLKKKFDGKLNDKNQILVNFQEGEMSENADIFQINKVPYEKGVHQVKIGERILIIAVDEILPPSPMTLDDATEQVKADLTEEIITQTIANQKKTTKIIIEPEFTKALEQNFKK